MCTCTCDCSRYESDDGQSESDVCILEHAVAKDSQACVGLHVLTPAGGCQHGEVCMDGIDGTHLIGGMHFLPARSVKCE